MDEIDVRGQIGTDKLVRDDRKAKVFGNTLITMKVFGIPAVNKPHIV